MNLVDSSAWLAYFADESGADRFLPALKDATALVVPTVVVYEVFKVVLRERDADYALRAAAAMHRGTVVELTSELAMAASRLSLEYALPMADSIVLATAQAYEATMWTLDAHFKALPNVKYFPRR